MVPRVDIDSKIYEDQWNQQNMAKSNPESGYQEFSQTKHEQRHDRSPHTRLSKHIQIISIDVFNTFLEVELDLLKLLLILVSKVLVCTNHITCS